MRSDVLLCGPVPRTSSDALEAAGLTTVGPVPPGACVSSVQRHRPTLVLLAAPAGAESATATVRAVRAATDALIAVAGAGDDLDQLLAFAAGADEVVPRGTSERLLLARVRALLGRRRPAEEDAVLSVGLLRLDHRARTVDVAGTELTLTRIEFDLLALLMEDPGRVVPRDEIVSRVWGDWYSDDHVVEVHLSRLRRKVADAGGPRVGTAVRGVGYRLGAERLAA
jgi:DNA-binding response OmpR family regulator